jgi:hypothetical protein
VFLQE